MIAELLMACADPDPLARGVSQGEEKDSTGAAVPGGDVTRALVVRSSGTVIYDGVEGSRNDKPVGAVVWETLTPEFFDCVPAIGLRIESSAGMGALLLASVSLDGPLASVMSGRLAPEGGGFLIELEPDWGLNVGSGSARVDTSDPRSLRIDLFGAEVAEGPLSAGPPVFGPPEDMTILVESAVDIPDVTNRCVGATFPVLEPYDGVNHCIDVWNLAPNADPCAAGASLL